MCGIVGIVGQAPVNQDLYDSLILLQHRGQDAAGIVTYDERDQRINLRKNNGYVREVFKTRHMEKLQGNMGIGHVRYPTAGSDDSDEAQPFYVSSPYGIALAHNGNLTNSEQLRKEVFDKDLRHINTTSDSELILGVFARELRRETGEHDSFADEVLAAAQKTMQRCEGGYSVVMLIAGKGIVAFRDPQGIRPLCVGRRGNDCMIASESAALQSSGFELLRSIEPSEVVYFPITGWEDRAVTSVPRNQRFNNFTPCIFEYVYFARPDSILDDVSVYKARLRMGDVLADRILERFGTDHDIDVVIPVPSTSRTAALPLAHRLGVKYREGFIKNRYVGRTFILPCQEERKKSVHHKLSVMDLEFAGKNVLLVDDSIVRGTTSKEIIQMARNAGAKKVYFASASPPIRYQNVYGIDMPCRSELVAHNRTEEEVGTLIGADILIYQTLDDLIAAIQDAPRCIDKFDASCFNGVYATGVSQDYLDSVEKHRRDRTF